MLLFMLSGCSLFNSDFEVITGQLNVGYSGREEERVICRNYTAEGDIGGLIHVPAYVFAVGHNNDFVIAKQHPIPGDDHVGEPDVNITNYYVIDINHKMSDSEILGPLSITQFDSVRTAYGIQDIQFDMNYPDKP
jgi:hypothetical protein